MKRPGRWRAACCMWPRWRCAMTMMAGGRASWPTGRRALRPIFPISGASKRGPRTARAKPTDEPDCPAKAGRTVNPTRALMKTRRLLLLLLVAAAIAAFFAFDLGRYLSLEALKARQESLSAYAALHPGRSAALFFAVYTAATA